jgi:hypothetical protein
MPHLRKHFIVLCFGLWALAACYPAPAPVQAYPPTPAANRPLPTSVPTGQEIVYNDFRVALSQVEVMTSYITEYGSNRNPAVGTKFLWVHITLKNVGQVERPLPTPEHFSVLYGISEFKPSYGHRQGTTDYTALKPVVYQGQQLEAWLRFDIPTNAELKDLQFAFFPESLQVSTSFAPTDYPWADHPIYLWSCAP